MRVDYWALAPITSEGEYDGPPLPISSPVYKLTQPSTNAVRSIRLKIDAWGLAVDGFISVTINHQACTATVQWLAMTDGPAITHRFSGAAHTFGIDSIAHWPGAGWPEGRPFAHCWVELEDGPKLDEAREFFAQTPSSGVSLGI